MYTHNVKFRVGKGAYYIEAEMGIDPSTKDVIYKLTNTSEPLRNDLLADFMSFANEFKVMTANYKEVDEIIIVKK